MAFPVPNIGDILMLSHLCWKIGCAFTAGRNGAPAEFMEVETQLRGLTGAITMLAETLDDEDGIYARCDVRTQKGLATIIGCCSQSLNNLEAFVTQYQDIKRSNEGGGMSVQGSWRKVLLRNWKTIAWTTEGGTIESLRSMLMMHAQSIQLAMHALQSRSLSRVENIIEPMADKMDDIHGKLTGDLDRKIEEIHKVILTLKDGQTPGDWSRRPLEENRPPSYHTNTPGRTPQPRPQSSQYDDLPVDDQRTVPVSEFDIKTPELSDSDVAYSPPIPQGHFMSGSSRGDRSQRNSGQQPNAMFYRLDATSPNYEAHGRKLSEQSQGSEALGVSPTSRPVHRMGSHLGGLSLELPPPAIDQNDRSSYYQSGRQSQQSYLMSPATPEERANPWMSRSSSQSTGRVTPMTPNRGSSVRSENRPMSPPSVRPITPNGALSTVTDQIEEEGFLRQEHHELRDSVAVANTAASRPSDVADQQAATPEQAAAFERELLTNSAVMCEVVATSIDYTIPDEEKPGDFLMQNACGECKVYLITRSAKISSGKTRFRTSVWILSHDRKTRLQIALPEDKLIVPYTVWSSPHKPIIRDEVVLTYHPASADEKPLSTHTTSWVTFTFPLPSQSDTLSPLTPTIQTPNTPRSLSASLSADPSTTLQNALMDGKQILLSVKTKRTMRLFEGVKGQFAFAEQLCAMENLRIVLDPTSGIVSAWLHYSPSFASGWMVFSLNVGRECIRVREEDEKVVRIKGLKIPVGERDKKTGGRRTSEAPEDVKEAKDGKKKKQEWVAGAKIEFSTVTDKKEFMEKLREVQDLGSVR